MLPQTCRAVRYLGTMPSEIVSFPVPEPISRSPKLNSDRFICPRCNSFAAQKWHELQYRGPGGSFINAADTEWSAKETENISDTGVDSSWRMSECTSCRHRSVWRAEQLIYPATSPAPVPSEDMPATVRELYDEASAVSAVSARAGAALARATLERLLKALDPEAPKGSRLDGYIARVIPNVNVATGKLLTLVRHVGNKSLHVEDAPDDAIVLLLSDEDAVLLGVLFETINDVVDELITRPKQAALLYDAVPATVRAAAEAKAAKGE